MKTDFCCLPPPICAGYRTLFVQQSELGVGEVNQLVDFREIEIDSFMAALPVGLDIELKYYLSDRRQSGQVGSKNKSTSLT